MRKPRLTHHQMAALLSVAFTTILHAQISAFIYPGRFFDEQDNKSYDSYESIALGKIRDYAHKRIKHCGDFPQVRFDLQPPPRFEGGFGFSVRHIAISCKSTMPEITSPTFPPKQEPKLN